MEKVNKSKSYILPLLAPYVDIGPVKHIDNSYLFLEGRDEIYIIIKYNSPDELEEYMETWRNSGYLMEEIKEELHLYIVFRVPQDIKKDVDKFLKGKFSKISQKKQILDFLKSNYGSSYFKAIQRIRYVLYKEQPLRNELEVNLNMTLPKGSELSSIPVKQEETLKL